LVINHTNNAIEPAPVIVTVYNREHHFKRCIAHLLECKEASETVLFVNSDAAGSDRDKKAVAGIRRYIDRITGFKKVVKVYHRQNIGSAKSYAYIFNKVFNSYDRCVFLEDDILVTPDFLAYMNKALAYYEDNKRVTSVSAFSYSMFFDIPIEKKKNVYFTHRFNPWGFGIWQDRFVLGQKYSSEVILNDLQNKNLIRRFNTIGIDLLPSFKYLASNKKALTLDLMHVFHMVKNNLVTVVPYSSKSFNIGNDGSGTRTRKGNRFINKDLKFLHECVEFQFVNNIDENMENSFSYKIYDSFFYRLKLVAMKLGLLDYGIRVKNWWAQKNVVVD